MSMEPIGIVSALQAKREAVVANLSPTARHAAFPKVYARPIPMPNEASKLRSELDAARVAIGHLKGENDKLKATVVELQARVEIPSEVLLQRLAQRRNSASDVITTYLAELNRARAEIGAEEYTRTHLISARRARPMAAPRHVCIWLVRNLCVQLSLPTIGKLMGGKDHTSCLHACERAPHWLATFPELKAAADATLRRFGATL